MSTFTLHPLELSEHAPIEVCYLQIGNRTPLLDFQKMAERSGLKKDLIKLSVYLRSIAFEAPLPKKLHKELRDVPAEDDWREYELKQGRLRLYYFLIPPDKSAVILGELKKGDKDQRKTIARFRKIKEEFKEWYLANQNEEE